MTNIAFRDNPTEEIVYFNGQTIYEDQHFEDHMDCQVPIQIYRAGLHTDIGFIEQYCRDYVKVNHTHYRREDYRFVSRPGY